MSTVSTVGLICNCCCKGVFWKFNDSPCYFKDEERSNFGTSHTTKTVLRATLQSCLKGLNFVGIAVDQAKIVMFSWALFCLIAGLVVQVLISGTWHDHNAN